MTYFKKIIQDIPKSLQWEIFLSQTPDTEIPARYAHITSFSYIFPEKNLSKCYCYYIKKEY